MLIRKLKHTPKDIIKFRTLRLHQLLYDGEDSYYTYTNTKNKDITHFQTYLHNNFFSNDLYNFLAIVDNGKEFLGMVGIQQLHYNQKHILYIKNMYVISEQRGKGYGTALLDFLLKNIKTTNIIKINLEVLMTNTIAHKMYINHGFKDIGIRKKNIYYHNKFYDVCLMEKYL